MSDDRIMVTVEGETLDIEYETLKSARASIDYLINMYGEDAIVDPCTGYGGEKYLAVRYTRLETDAEYAQRIKREAYYATEQARREREEYERLKAKFGHS